jgi:hypothetical protein
VIRASVEVKDENGAFSVAVCAENLRRAVEFAASRYPGRAAVAVLFPLDPQAFFVEGSTVSAPTVEFVAETGSQQERGQMKRSEPPRRAYG